MDNSLGFAAERSLSLKKILEAENILLQSDLSRKKRKKVIKNILHIPIIQHVKKYPGYTKLYRSQLKLFE